MSGTVMIPGSPSHRSAQRPGVRGDIIAAGRGLAFGGLMLAGLGLLLVPVIALILVGLGAGVVIGATALPGIQRAVLGLLLILTGLLMGRLLMLSVLLAVRRLAILTRRLAREWCGVPIAEAYLPPPGIGIVSGTGNGKLSFRQRLWWLASDPATWRDLLWATMNAVVGWILALLPAMLVGVGLIGFIAPTLRHVIEIPPPAFPGNSPAVLILIGTAFVTLGLAAAPWLLRAYGGFAGAMLGPPGQAELALRVRHLAQTRAETLDSGAAEIRRIERDLHDGAQARLVAMGMALSAADELLDANPAAARALLTEARDASAKALAELRALVRGVHPPVLADRGLAAAIQALALDSRLKVDVLGSLPGRPQPPVESAAYFAVCELLANVSKHAGARQAWIDMRYEHGLLRVDVADDGHGGADPAAGTGLHGIERRLAAFDGILALNSPPGGPTVVTMEIPCALSSPKTSSC
ncbi:MAG: histidine kinase [Streptosporangiaceae bacterium]